MKKTVCDFCRRNVKEGGIRFEHRGKRYRVDISVYTDSNRVRASRTDACAACTFKYAIMAAKAILKEAEEQRNRKRQCAKMQKIKKNVKQTKFKGRK